MRKNDYWNTPVGRANRPHYPGHNLYPVDYVTDYRFTCIVSIPKTNTKTGGTFGDRWQFRLYHELQVLQPLERPLRAPAMPRG